MVSTHEKGKELEDKVVDLLKSLGCSNVIATKATGDGGTDVYANILFHGKTIGFAIECKNYQSNKVNKVDVKVVRNLHSSMMQRLDGELRVGYIITTSRFTQDAREEARNISKRDPKFQIYLSEYDDFEHHFKSTYKNRDSEDTNRENPKTVRNHYEVLGITKNATPDDIKTVWKRLRIKYSIDDQYYTDESGKFVCRLSKDEEANITKMLQDINIAYEVLSDSQKRATYDAYLNDSENRVRREQEERKRRAETERRAKEEQEAKAKRAREAEQRAKEEEANRKAHEEANRKAREAREELERKARENTERKIREDAERRARETKDRAEAERIRREESERKVRYERDEKTRELKEAAEKLKREHAESQARIKSMEAERQAHLALIDAERQHEEWQAAQKAREDEQKAKAKELKRKRKMRWIKQKIRKSSSYVFAGIFGIIILFIIINSVTTHTQSQSSFVVAPIPITTVQNPAVTPTIVHNQTPVDMTIASDTNLLSLASTPSNADIYIDDELKGTTPMDIKNIAEGHHVVVFKLSGCEDCRKDVDIRIGTKTTLDVDLIPIQSSEVSPKPIYGDLHVSSTPYGAAIHVDQYDFGTTPANVRNIPTGVHNVTLTLANYEVWSQLVDVKTNDSIDLSPTLIPINSEVTSVITQKPAGTFSANIITGKAPLQVKFSSQTSGNPISYFWQFEPETSDDWSSYHSVTANHTFKHKGTYDISLTITNENGSTTISKPSYIIVT